MSAFEGLDANYVLVTTILGVGISVAVGLAWSALTLRNVRRGRPPTRVAAALLWIVAAANLVLTTAYALRSLPVMRDAPQWFGPAEYGWVIGGWVAVLFITSVTAKTLVSVPRQSSSSR